MVFYEKRRAENEISYKLELQAQQTVKQFTIYVNMEGNTVIKLRSRGLDLYRNFHDYFPDPYNEIQPLQI